MPAGRASPHRGEAPAKRGRDSPSHRRAGLKRPKTPFGEPFPPRGERLPERLPATGEEHYVSPRQERGERTMTRMISILIAMGVIAAAFGPAAYTYASLA